ncbi:MAG TPA: hypothetical protein VLJ17_19940 [Xanthobacteraceae bacterium]|nr:hypothetical protein [Xanthobacteraceae bacterium]
MLFGLSNVVTTLNLLPAAIITTSLNDIALWSNTHALGVMPTLLR